MTEWTESRAIWRVPPREGPLPESVEGIRVGDPATLTLARELIAAGELVLSRQDEDEAIEEPSLRLRHEARLLAFVLEAHGPGEADPELCAPCSTHGDAIRWPCIVTASMASQLRKTLAQFLT